MLLLSLSSLLLLLLLLCYTRGIPTVVGSATWSLTNADSLWPIIAASPRIIIIHTRALFY